MTDRKATAAIPRRIRMGAILSVLRPLDATSCATADCKRRLIASVCRMIGDELFTPSKRPLRSSIAAVHRAARDEPPHGVDANRKHVSRRDHDSSRDSDSVSRDSNSSASRDPKDGSRHARPVSGAIVEAVIAADEQLSPRLRQTLRSLLAGDSEKQCARRLGLSPHTVHVYVKKLYQRYGVSSRGELLARWVNQA